MTTCLGDPPECCEAPVVVPRDVRRNYPTRCPWLGHDAICPTFQLDRDTWWCCWCRREFTTEV